MCDIPRSPAPLVGHNLQLVTRAVALADMTDHSRSHATTSSASTGFFQDPPSLSNQYSDDALLGAIVRTSGLAGDELVRIQRDLLRFGDIVVSKMVLSACNDAESNPPVHISHDAWGKRIDELRTSAGWKTMKAIAAREGLVAMAYENDYGVHARLCQFAKYYLFAASSAVYTCPMSMADGAARVIERQGDRAAPQLRDAFAKLTSRDPKRCWTSGQWMTERTGGSDVSRTETIAIKSDGPGNAYTIKGFKFFSSATDSDMMMLLARVPGTKGLSLFSAEMRLDNGRLNGIRISRLKPKLGTRAVPTAELELDGMRAVLVGEIGRGIPNIIPMLNITRIHAAVNSVAFLRRALAIAESYAGKRQAFGKLLKDHPLHARTLFDLQVTWRACLLVTFFGVDLLGRCERGQPGAMSALEDLLRMITPIVKAWVSKLCVSAISECIEALGGQGYMEDVGLARLLRDCQVNTIWEGTTNILSIDLRKMLILPDKGEALWAAIEPICVEGGEQCCQRATLNRLARLRSTLRTEWLQEQRARDLLFEVGEILAASLMIRHAHRTSLDADKIACHHWCKCGKPSSRL